MPGRVPGPQTFKKPSSLAGGTDLRESPVDSRAAVPRTRPAHRLSRPEAPSGQLCTRTFIPKHSGTVWATGTRGTHSSGGPAGQGGVTPERGNAHWSVRLRHIAWRWPRPPDHHARAATPTELPRPPGRHTRAATPTELPRPLSCHAPEPPGPPPSCHAHLAASPELPHPQATAPTEPPYPPLGTPQVL